MYNLKEIRKDFDSFKKSLQHRNIDIDLDYLKKLDQLNRELIQKKENFEKEKKNISKLKDKSLFKKLKMNWINFFQKFLIYHKKMCLLEKMKTTM